MRYVEWVDCLKRGSLSVSAFIACVCATLAQKRQKMRKRELQIGFIGFVLWLVHSCSKFMFALALLILTYANNAQKCLDGTHSHTHTTLDSVYKLKSYEFEFQSIFFSHSRLVCLFVTTHSFPSASFFVTLGLPLSAATQLLKHTLAHAKTRPLPISIIIFEAKKTASLKKLYKQIKLNLFLFGQ